MQADVILKHEADFFGITRFPGVVEAIDVTRVRIVAPTEHEVEFLNRKNFHSIKVQNVSDANHRILDIVSTWAGATYDASILRESGLFEILVRHMSNKMPPSWELWISFEGLTSNTIFDHKCMKIS